MSQRDYQLLRFPHSNINISLSSSQFSSSKVLQHEAYQLSSAGREIILLVLGLFARAPASIILFLSCPPDYPCFSSKQNSFPLSPSSIIVSLWCLWTLSFSFDGTPARYNPCFGFLQNGFLHIALPSVHYFQLHWYTGTVNCDAQQKPIGVHYFQWSPLLISRLSTTECSLLT